MRQPGVKPRENEDNASSPVRAAISPLQGWRPFYASSQGFSLGCYEGRGVNGKKLRVLRWAVTWWMGWVNWPELVPPEPRLRGGWPPAVGRCGACVGRSK